MADSSLLVAAQTCVADLKLESQGSPVRVDIFADEAEVLREVETLRTSALRLISEADSIVASITERTGETVPPEEFVNAVRNAVAQRLFVTGLPHRGSVLSLEDLIEQVTLKPDGDFDLLIDRLAEELGVPLDADLGTFCKALNRDINPDQPDSSFVRAIAILSRWGGKQAPGKIVTMLQELKLNYDDPKLQVSPDTAEKLRRILILNRRLKERVSQK